MFCGRDASGARAPDLPGSFCSRYVVEIFGTSMRSVVILGVSIVSRRLGIFVARCAQGNTVCVKGVELDWHDRRGGNPSGETSKPLMRVKVEVGRRDAGARDYSCRVYASSSANCNLSDGREARCARLHGILVPRLHATIACWALIITYCGGLDARSVARKG